MSFMDGPKVDIRITKCVILLIYDSAPVAPKYRAAGWLLVLGLAGALAKHSFGFGSGGI